MKKFLFFAITLTAASAVRCQELLFKVDQSATAYKNSKTGKFTDAEVNDTPSTIFLRNNIVVVDGNTKASYTLNKKITGKKSNNSIVSYSYTGRDNNNGLISFVYTVNLHSKEAVIEVSDRELKNYYFGTFSSPELTSQQ